MNYNSFQCKQQPSYAQSMDQMNKYKNQTFDAQQLPSTQQQLNPSVSFQNQSFRLNTNSHEQKPSQLRMASNNVSTVEKERRQSEAVVFSPEAPRRSSISDQIQNLRRTSAVSNNNTSSEWVMPKPQIVSSQDEKKVCPKENEADALKQRYQKDKYDEIAKQLSNSAAYLQRIGRARDEMLDQGPEYAGNGHLHKKIVDQEKLIEQQRIEIQQFVEELSNCREQMTKPQLHSLATQDLIVKQRHRINDLEQEAVRSATQIITLQHALQKSDLALNIREETIRNREISLDDFRRQIDVKRKSCGVCGEAKRTIMQVMEPLVKRLEQKQRIEPEVFRRQFFTAVESATLEQTEQYEQQMQLLSVELNLIKKQLEECRNEIPRLERTAAEALNVLDSDLRKEIQELKDQLFEQEITIKKRDERILQLQKFNQVQSLETNTYKVVADRKNATIERQRGELKDHQDYMRQHNYQVRSLVRNVQSEISQRFTEMKRETSKLRREHDDIFKAVGGQGLVRKSVVRDKMTSVYQQLEDLKGMIEQ